MKEAFANAREKLLSSCAPRPLAAGCILISGLSLSGRRTHLWGWSRWPPPPVPQDPQAFRSGQVRPGDVNAGVDWRSQLQPRHPGSMLALPVFGPQLSRVSCKEHGPGRIYWKLESWRQQNASTRFDKRCIFLPRWLEAVQLRLGHLNASQCPECLYTPIPVCGKFHVTMSVPACGNLIPFLRAGLQGLSCPALQFNCPLFEQL